MAEHYIPLCTMRRTALMILSGLCALSSSLPHHYVYIEQKMTWHDAQSYCRKNFIDLASVHNEEDNADLSKVVTSEENVWIGLNRDTETWRWSLENKSFYGDGEAEFRMWSPGEPNGGSNYYILCTLMLNTGLWADAECSETLEFICYTGSNGNSSSFILIREKKTWMDAQSYCREHYIDLASVRNLTENEELKGMIHGEYRYTWIGLYRGAWTWSDGTDSSFSSWITGAPVNETLRPCVSSNSSKWSNEDCGNKHSFVCNRVPTMVVVRMVLEADSSADMEQLKEETLQKLTERMKQQKPGQSFKLRWVEQPDGKVFHKKKDGQDEEPVCTQN